MPKNKKTGLETTSTKRRKRTGLRGKVVAVAGANSFLGRNLVGLFETRPQIQKIVALDIQRPSSAGNKTRYYETDVAQPNADEALAEILDSEHVDTLVHVAFLSSPTHATEWAHEFESIGTMHLLSAARQTRIRKVVQWSQTFLYGALPNNPQLIPESQPLRASDHACFCKDKIEAEHEVQRFAESSDTLVTVLRTAPLLGPSVRDYVTNYLSHHFVPTLLGYDPLWQFTHEMDAVNAFETALTRDVPGTFNIVSRGMLRLSTAIRLAGRFPLPIPHPFAYSISRGLWLAQASKTPPGFLDHLRYPCLANGSAAEQKLGYVPMYTARDAVQDFAKALHLRDVQLLDEK